MRVLGTPCEVRNVLRYVLLNARKHVGRMLGRRLDPASSARWFDSWTTAPPPRPEHWPSPVARARTWLLHIGYGARGMSSDATAFALYEQGGYALTVRLVIVSIAGSSRGTLAVYDIPSGERSVTKVQALFARSDRPVSYRCSRPHAGDAG